MANNKVIYNGNTLIDLTDTTAVASDVARGKVFYGANGEKIVGTAIIGAVPSRLVLPDDNYLVMPDGNILTVYTPVDYGG